MNTLDRAFRAAVRLFWKWRASTWRHNAALRGELCSHCSAPIPTEQQTGGRLLCNTTYRDVCEEDERDSAW